MKRSFAFVATPVDNFVEVRGIEPRSESVPTCGFHFRLHRSPPVLGTSIAYRCLLVKWGAEAPHRLASYSLPITA